MRREKLSRALGTGDSAPLLKQNVFAVQNYHKARSAQDPGERKILITWYWATQRGGLFLLCDCFLFTVSLESYSSVRIHAVHVWSIFESQILVRVKHHFALCGNMGGKMGKYKSIPEHLQSVSLLILPKTWSMLCCCCCCFYCTFFAVLDLASLECLESVIEAGGRYVDERYQQQQEGCTIA